MFKSIYTRMLVACAALTAVANPLYAQDKNWWPIKVIDASSGTDQVIDYTPVEKASKAYSACVLIPHLKDANWVSMMFGLESEIRRVGMNMTLFEAGGYDNLPRQLSQFDDCLASSPDIMIVAPISEAGLSQKFAEAKKRNIPVVVWINPVLDPNAVTAKVFADYTDVGEIAGKFATEHFKGTDTNTVVFPGPAGSGWAENVADGFTKGTDGGSVKVLEQKFGETGVSTQLQLVQDSLQAYPEMNLIYGSGVTIEAALGAVAQAGRSDIKMFSAFASTELIEAVRRGNVFAVGSELVALEGHLAVDLAVRILDHKPYSKFIRPIPVVITKDNVDKVDLSLIINPTGWKPEFSIKQQ
ncbi:TMAO reductase system periplasmic protein TorT [Agrobacterium rubi]|uniref:TMAO reductase system periplasmic protein TorT n=1 Tax=Agrobacterium rubi TaxID=28099 RepID=UPI00157225AF|nr:TMAO reductase system periplasmic protein TorT [Agrobacterium rubi]NTF10548.1 TMAO reductase system periplasmic protein TorT [Agrobacterium rubi]NTF22942.1 TMAO reductase system periplasmic protein TorT [Agrobacterium rubi]NTF29873.1 TMAO reductase system periplasmic protein TorT [Agrobacterium rubi]